MSTPIFGKIIKRRRQELKLSISTVAVNCGLDPGHLSRIERGVQKPPDIVPRTVLLLDFLGFNDGELEYVKSLAGIERHGLELWDKYHLVRLKRQQKGR